MHLKPAATGLAVMAGLLVLYTAAPARFLGNDTRPAVYSAISLVKRGDLDLDEFSWTIRGNDADWPYFVVPTTDGRVVSRYGVGGPLTAAPVFAAVAAVRPRLSETVAMMLGRLVAALCVSAAAMLVFLTALRAGAGQGTALLVAAAYGLGTCAFSLASQALWQHGPAQLFLALGTYLLVRAGPCSLPASGAAFAAVVLCRPPDVVLAMAAAVFVVVVHRRQPRRWLGFLGAAAAVAAVQLAYNTAYFGAPWTFGQMLPRSASTGVSFTTWDHPILAGLAGLLVSPSRGLFVYSPVFLALLWRPVRNWRASTPPLRVLLLGAAGLVLLMSRYAGWWGGWCFGYRMIGDAAPVLALGLLPVIARLGRWSRGLFAAALAASVLIHAAGAFNYSPFDWDMHPDVELHQERLWSVGDSQLRHVFTHRMNPEPLSIW